MINEGIKPIFRMINPPTRRRSPYRDLATTHGTAAALKAEAPQVDLEEQYMDACTLLARAAVLERAEKVIAQRAARKVRMARKRRRGW